MKYINFKRYKFSTVLKSLNTLKYNFFKIFKSIGFKVFDFGKFFKNLDLGRFNFTKIIRYFDPKIYSIHQLKKINFISTKFLFVHLPVGIIFFGFLYLFIPTLFNYDKSNVENIICKYNNIQCAIKGEISYRFYPTPRLKIKDLVINGFDKENTFIKAKDAFIKLSFKNLLAKEKHTYKKLQLNNFEANIDLKNFKKYKNIFNKENNYIPTNFKNGKIILYDKNNYLASIRDVNIKTKLTKDSIESELKGKFLGDNIYINFDSKESANLILKMTSLNFLTKVNFINDKKDENFISGNFLIKKDKNKIAGIFDYKNNKIIIKKSNLTNSFLNGELEGEIELLPYFSFNLESNLNTMNFTKLYNHFLALDEEEKEAIFKINNKINGKLNLSADKIYSKYGLVNSFESRLKFNNGNIFIEQFLMNLGKLGASDVLGSINNDKKYTNFKFESNIFVDNQKKFLSKFGIYNKEKISSNFFVSGSLDLNNLRCTFYEMSDDEKLNRADVNYIEKEFNNLMLEDGYKSLFDFPNFKEFIKSITTIN
tara:strand:+ start:6 stop:1622 length:1617 start_codon:yes stop_codon:yes gene_type:complete